jgi:hypothetical protein
VPVTPWPPGTDVGETEIAVRETAATLIVSVATAEVVSRVAWIETFPPAKVPIVVMGKVADVNPDATVTVAGTVTAEVFELERETTSPEVGAGPVSVTVPWDATPAVTVEGFSEAVAGRGAETFRGPIAETPPAVAVRRTCVDAARAVVVTANVAEVAAALTTTVAGIEAAAELEE